MVLNHYRIPISPCSLLYAFDDAICNGIDRSPRCREDVNARMTPTLVAPILIIPKVPHREDSTIFCFIANAARTRTIGGERDEKFHRDIAEVVPIVASCPPLRIRNLRKREGCTLEGNLLFSPDRFPEGLEAVLPDHIPDEERNAGEERKPKRPALPQKSLQ